MKILNWLDKSDLGNYNFIVKKVENLEGIIHTICRPQEQLIRQPQEIYQCHIGDSTNCEIVGKLFSKTNDTLQNNLKLNN